MPHPPASYDIYWNTTKKVWSVRFKAKVIEHLKQGYIEAATTKVSKMGRERVRREGVKNVHAFIVCSKIPIRYSYIDISKLLQVYYNPYNVERFMVINGEDFEYANSLSNVYFTPKGKVYCLNNT